jgi:hypothetical protein
MYTPAIHREMSSNYNFHYNQTKRIETLHDLHAFLQARKAYFIFNFPKINQSKILL